MAETCARVAKGNVIFITLKEPSHRVTGEMLFGPDGMNLRLVLRKNGYFSHMEDMSYNGCKCHSTFCTR